jgi:hypothetical protein
LGSHISEYFELQLPIKLKGKMPDKLDIAKWIKGHHPDEYQHISVDRIRREVILVFKPINARLKSAIQAAVMRDK